VPDLSWADVLLRLAVAAALGASIGLERELRERAAGLRTHLLVAVGSCMFTLVSAYAWGSFTFGHGTSFDPSRIAAQIVTGIGFLGAGAIIRQGISVRGLTTAATLWVVAGIGMAAGAGYYRGAVLGTAVVLVALWPLRIIGAAIAARARHGRLIVEVRPGESAALVLSALEESGADPQALEFAEEEGRRRIAVDLRLPAGASQTSLVAQLSERPEVVGAEWAE
jgi:putative Mg2+ transporter-C (MgtC) family protein